MESRFRFVLVAGAVIFGALAAFAWLLPSGFAALLGMEISVAFQGFAALTRLYGGFCAVIAGGYAIAAMKPESNRGLLAILFWVPVVNIMASVAAVTGDDFSVAGALIFAAWNLALALLFFRFYPRSAVRNDSEASSDSSDLPPSVA